MSKHSLLFISVFSSGSLQLAINHLTSIKKQNITNYMSFAMDNNAYEKIKSLGFNVELVLDIPYFSKDKKDFGTSDFTYMSFVRYKVIHEMLKKYDAVWYLDVDTVVLGDLNKYFIKHWDNNTSGVDMVFQNDIHMICSGCVIYFSNEKTLIGTKHMYDHMNNNVPDQHFLGAMIQQNSDYYKTELMDYMDFPNGLLYFDESIIIGVPPQFAKIKRDYEMRKQNRPPLFVHANWIVGNENKERALRTYGLFFI